MLYVQKGIVYMGWEGGEGQKTVKAHIYKNYEIT